MDKPICEVCKKHPSDKVVASSYGPCSYATCNLCFKQDAEPFWVINATYEILKKDGKDTSHLNNALTYYYENPYIRFGAIMDCKK